MNNKDEKFMAFALAQAKMAFGMTSPNPMVGAVIVKDGVIIGRGYHHRAGKPHAEPMAILDAKLYNPGMLPGSTLYVTLEPCSTYGRTPPCCDAIAEAGISRVVIGTLDQNPEHSGAAIEILRSHNIEVECGVLERKCRELNESFFWWITHKRPFVLLKMAMTLDGKIATLKGDSKWVSCEESRTLVQKMRRWADAVMVGGETARMDNPSLLVRKPENWKMQPRRFIWSNWPLLDSNSMLRDNGPAPEIVKPMGHDEWIEFLEKIGSENVTALLLEGGGELAGYALEASIVNKVAFFIAPKLLCGRGSRPVVAGENPSLMSEALQLRDMDFRQVGKDLLVTGYIDS